MERAMERLVIENKALEIDPRPAVELAAKAAGTDLERNLLRARGILARARERAASVQWTATALPPPVDAEDTR